MILDISGIIEAKLAQMEADGTIRKKIEDALEKAVLAAVTSEIDSYGFTREIRDEMGKAIGGVAQRSGLAAYNGFIAEKVRQIVQGIAADDLEKKLQSALDGVLVQKHENVKLSDVFRQYNEWVCQNTEEPDKYDRQYYTAELEVSHSGSFTYYRVKFADRPDASKSYSSDPDEMPDIEMHFTIYGKEDAARISTLSLDGTSISKNLRIGVLTEFEAFLVNLYYNQTKVLMDMDDADDFGYFDADV